jgi:hypothetical protein
VNRLVRLAGIGALLGSASGAYATPAEVQAAANLDRLGFDQAALATSDRPKVGVA